MGVRGREHGRKVRTSAQDLLSNLGEKPPYRWENMSESAKLDYVAGRVLAQDRRRRGVTSHNAMKAEGYLSVSQLERRINREVFSDTGDLSRTPQRGVFSRTYRRPRPSK